jgi:hypothetical protein
MWLTLRLNIDAPREGVKKTDVQARSTRNKWVVSYGIGVLLALMLAVVVGAIAEGAFKEGEDQRIAGQIGRQHGFSGMTSSQVRGMREAYGQEGCTSGGTTMFWAIWIVGTGLIGSWLRRRSHAKAAADSGLAEPSVEVLPFPEPAAASPSSKSCPYCAETILAAAIKCKHCGERLDRDHS